MRMSRKIKSLKTNTRKPGDIRFPRRKHTSVLPSTTRTYDVKPSPNSESIKMGRSLSQAEQRRDYRDPMSDVYHTISRGEDRIGRTTTKSFDKRELLLAGDKIPVQMSLVEPGRPEVGSESRG